MRLCMCVWARMCLCMNVCVLVCVCVYAHMWGGVQGCACTGCVGGGGVQKIQYDYPLLLT